MRRRDVLKVVVAGCAGMLTPRAYGQAPPEILIRRGRVVNADGVREADVRVVGSQVAEIGAGLKPRDGARIIEAAGRLVLPGGIDPHTHLHPGFVDDMTSGSMAALAGGITTVGTFANATQGETLTAAIDRMAARVRSEAICDVILHAGAWPPSPEIAAAMKAIAEAGQPSFKIFMTRADFGARLQLVIQQLEAARDAGVVTLMHCEDGALLAAAVRRLEAEGRTTLRDYGESRPLIAEVAATQQAAALCESTRAPLYIVHLSSARALDATRAAKRAKLPFFIETRPLYLHLTSEKMRGPDAPLYVGQPPLREREDRDAMWRGIADGSIDVLATDHAPWTREQKLDPGLTITRLRPGVSDLQTILPMFFSEGVHARKLPLTRFVECSSTNAARIFGLYPKKGVIREGSDADITIWDPKHTAPVLAANDHSKSDYSVYEGWKVTGWPVTTIRRGEVMYDGGKIVGQAGSGQLVRRERWRG
ncbi:MAG TPA: amidohydrolase family protein [Vicinamibacterales bacterium]|nr:amidohydrolase family protein [Vicinamibacterales bacterium]